MTPPSQGPDALKNLLAPHLQLRQDLIQRVIERDFAGNNAAFGRSLELEHQPHRKTILHWARQQKGLPKSPQRLLALGQALDVDPFLLLDLSPELLAEACNVASWNLTWGSVHKAMAFLNELFALTPEHWPPEEIANYFDGEWYLHSFVHDPTQGRHYFQAFLLQPEAFFNPAGQFEAHREPPGLVSGLSQRQLAKPCARGQNLLASLWHDSPGAGSGLSPALYRSAGKGPTERHPGTFGLRNLFRSRGSRIRNRFAPSL